MAEVKRRSAAEIAGVAAMYVHVLPLVVALMPDSRLFWLMSVSVALSERMKRRKKLLTDGLTLEVLHNLTCRCTVSNERKQCMLFHRPANERVDWGWSYWWPCSFFPALQNNQDCKTTERIHNSNLITIFKIEFMEIHPFNQIAQRFWLKCG